MANWRKAGADAYEFMEPVSIQRFPERLSVEAQLSFNQNSAEDAMKYLCLIYDEETRRGTMPKEQMDAMMGEYGAFTEGIRKSGKYVAGEALQPTQTATTVRVRQGKISTSDGPFAETKEQLGGFYLINATDLNEAIQLASRIPSARTGSVEVRPVRVFDAQ
jgi:hypothetical protein